MPPTNSTVKDTGEVPAHFLPFGALLGDSIVPHLDETSTGAIQLSEGIRFFGTTYNQIHVSVSLRCIRPAYVAIITQYTEIKCDSLIL